MRGVYFLGNDRVIDLAIALLNSFRLHNPELALCLIPFDQDIDELRKLQSTYKFSIFDNGSLLERCDRISHEIHNTVLHHYRKLVMWEGAFDEFLYLDLDMVVLRNIDFVFPLLVDHEFVTATSNIPRIRKWVWHDSILHSGKLSMEQIDFAANTGFIVSRKSCLTLNAAEMALEGLKELAPHMNLDVYEQAFLNYLIVTSARKYTSLHALQRSSTFEDLPIEQWAARPGLVVDGGQLSYPGESPTVVVHWAGQWRLRKWERTMFRVLKKLKLIGEIPAVSLAMPNRKLWEYYRHLRVH